MPAQVGRLDLHEQPCHRERKPSADCSLLRLLTDPGIRWSSRPRLGLLRQDRPDLQKLASKRDRLARESSDHQAERVDYRRDPRRPGKADLDLRK